MKKLITLFCLAVAVNLSAQTYEINFGTGQQAQETWINLETGSTHTANATNWQFAFQFATRTAAVLINPWIGMELYQAGTDFEQVIEVESVASMKRWLNSDTTWNVGALNLGIDSWNVVSFDYGWGTYNPATHNLAGKNVYVAKFADGTYKKIFINMRYAAGAKRDTWEFSVADLDGSNKEMFTIDHSQLKSKHFLYFDIFSGQTIDREPDFNNWDLTFTKYQTIIQAGPNTMYQTVTGVLNHQNTRAIKVSRQDYESGNLPELNNFSRRINTIGYDWKSYNYQNDTYTLKNDVYFVQRFEQNTASAAKVGDLYVVSFDTFDHKAGTSIMNVSKVTSVEYGENIQLALYPNVVTSSSNMNLLIDTDNAGSFEVKIIDMLGNIIDNFTYYSAGAYNIPISSKYATGSYKLLIHNANFSTLLKFSVIN